jgi:diacylglycerol O-acyltransferase
MEDPPDSRSQRSPLTEEDARILTLESGPIQGHTLKVLVLESAGEPLSVHELRHHLAERVAHEPRWRQRLVADPSAAAGLAWEADPTFDIARHVDEAAPGADLDDDSLRGLIIDAMREPLARDRPLWSVLVVPRLAGDRSAVLWKVHHSLADGMTVMRAGPRLLWSEE